MQIPSSDSHLINELSKWLRMAGSRSKVVVVFDALNQLDDGSGQDGTFNLCTVISTVRTALGTINK